MGTSVLGHFDKTRGARSSVTGRAPLQKLAPLAIAAFGIVGSLEREFNECIDENGTLPSVSIFESSSPKVLDVVHPC